MRVLNINGNEPLIIHANGNAKFEPIYYQMIPNNIPFNKPDDLTIIICETDLNETLNDECYINNQLLLQQFKINNIPYINAYDYANVNEEFSLIKKIYYYNNALKYVNTPYVLLLDSRDVKIRTLDGIIDRFLTYDTEILFGAEKTNANIQFTHIEQSNETHGSSMKYANTGCIIGYTKSLQRFLQNASDKLNNDNITTYMGDIIYNNHLLYIDIGDQGYLRSLFNDYRKHILNVDYKSLIFMNCANTDIYLN